jgi:hypothetical protein
VVAKGAEYDPKLVLDLPEKKDLGMISFPYSDTDTNNFPARKLNFVATLPDR